VEPRPDTVDVPDTHRRLTEPLEAVIWVMLALTVAVLAIGVIGTVASRDVSIFGFGHGATCASVSQTGPFSTGPEALSHFRPGTSETSGSLQVCADHPTLEQRFLVTLTQAPTYFLYLAVLVQLWLLLQTVRRHGPFALGVSQRLRFLGWFILAGSLAAGAGQSAARAGYAATAITGPVPVWTDIINGVLGNLIPLLLIVCGLLTLARIIRAGAHMYDELAGTV
jgi:hypothetical protein